MEEMDLLFVGDSGLTNWGWILMKEGKFIEDNGRTTETIDDLLLDVDDAECWAHLHNKLEVLWLQPLNNDERIIFGEIFNKIRNYYKNELGIKIKSLRVVYNCRFIREVF